MHAAGRSRGSDLPSGPDDSTRRAGPPSTADLVDRYGDMVFHLALRLTGDRDEARDLAQDAFVRILKGIASFRAESSEKTWVFQVVINCHRNRRRWWRRLKRARTVSLDAPIGASDDPGAATLGAMIPDPAPGPDRHAAGEEARRRLQAALLNLPDDQRAAILLREVEGLGYAEIAAVMGVPIGTVKSRIGRARDALRTALADLRGHRAGEGAPA